MMRFNHDIKKLQKLREQSSFQVWSAGAQVALEIRQIRLDQFYLDGRQVELLVGSVTMAAAEAVVVVAAFSALDPQHVYWWHQVPRLRVGQCLHQ